MCGRYPGEAVPHGSLLPERIIFNSALRVNHHRRALFYGIGRPGRLALGAWMTSSSERGPHFTHVQRSFFAIGISADKPRAGGSFGSFEPSTLTLSNLYQISVA